VAPNGDIYVLAGPTAEQIAELEKAGLRRPSAETVKNSRLLQVFSSDGKLKTLSALPGLCGQSDKSCLQVRVGRSGAVYLAGMFHPGGQDVPDGIAPDGKYLPTAWGGVVKFGSSFDMVSVGSIAGSWGSELRGKPTHYAGGWRIPQGTPIRMGNVLWTYGGIAPVVQVGCTCEGSSFDVDRFERVFVPAVQTCSVNVLDTNGNLILRVGKYGNADNRGKDGPAPDPDLAFIFPRYVTTTDEAIYVDDEENHRIVRAVLSYEAEETVALP
jgi:hypothetical protein